MDLRPSEEEIWAGMKSSCRTAIRKAERSGVVIEEASDIEFADDYYAQLEDVFAKQSLVPPYDVERIRELIRHVHPTGRLLLLRARNPEGDCIATGIFPAMSRSMHFLVGASWRDQQRLCPNEPLMWHAIKYWKGRGVRACDLGGYMSYKRKWGGHEVRVPFLRKSRSRTRLPDAEPRPDCVRCSSGPAGPHALRAEAICGLNANPHPHPALRPRGHRGPRAAGGLRGGSRGTRPRGRGGL